MLGFLRLVLASLVALSHADVALGGRHVGVPAVVVFYVLAGYIVVLQWDVIRRGRSRKAAAFAFLRDRFWRLAPVYLAALAVAALVVAALRPESYFLSREFGAACAAGNLAIVPLNFYAFNGLDRCSLIPVAWSLGLEIQFYLVFPLIMIVPRLAVPLAALSIAVYGAALAGFVHTDIWGYRLLPGTLFMFGIGAALAAATLSGSRATLMVALAATPAALAALAVVAGTGQAGVFFTLETLVGLVVAVPLILAARAVPRSKLDDLAGLAAYPLFLVHFSLIWTFRARLPGLIETPAGLALYLAAATATALVLALAIDRPLGRWRRAARENVAMSRH